MDMQEKDKSSPPSEALNELGKSFARVFSERGLSEDDAVEALMEALDSISVNRDVMLHQSNTLLKSLLSKSI